MAPSGISVNKPVAVGILILVSGTIVFYRWGWISSPFSSKVPETPSEGQTVTVAAFSKQEKLVEVSKLEEAPGKGVEDVKVSETPITVSVGDKKLTVFSRQASPKGTAKMTVLLLHGAAFTSKDWDDIKMLHHLAVWGYKAVAIDLPGHGKSTNSLDTVKEEDFMKALVEGLEAKQVVIVSPSMSGRFSLPYLFSDAAVKSPPPKVIGFVPVAPISTTVFKRNYPKSQLPTLVVHGDKDTTLGAKSRQDLRNLPKAEIAVIPNAKHACYMDQRPAFRKALYYFLQRLKKE